MRFATSEQLPVRQFDMVLRRTPWTCPGQSGQERCGARVDFEFIACGNEGSTEVPRRFAWSLRILEALKYSRYSAVVNLFPPTMRAVTRWFMPHLPTREDVTWRSYHHVAERIAVRCDRDGCGILGRGAGPVGQSVGGYCRIKFIEKP